MSERKDKSLWVRLNRRIWLAREETEFPIERTVLTIQFIQSCMLTAGLGLMILQGFEKLLYFPRLLDWVRVLGGIGFALLVPVGCIVVFTLNRRKDVTFSRRRNIFLTVSSIFLFIPWVLGCLLGLELLL